jgi:hypothetical protein
VKTPDWDTSTQDVIRRQEAVERVRAPMPMYVNPYLVLLEELTRCHAQVVILESEVRSYDAQGGAHQSRPGAKTMQRWERERDRMLNVAKTCIGLGIAERQVRLAERNGELIARVMIATAERLGLTPEQRLALPALVTEQVQLLSAEATVVDTDERMSK